MAHKKLAAFVILFIALGWHAGVRAASGLDDEDFALRQYDEVYFKDGSVEKGLLIATDSPDTLKIKNLRTSTVRPFSTSDTKEIRRRATPDTELKRLMEMAAGNPDKILRVAKKASRYADLGPKVVQYLEKQVSSRNPELLGYLCGLYLAAGRTNDAVTTGETLVGAAPGQAHSYLWRGQAYLSLERIEDAEKDLERAFKMAPEDEDVLIVRASVLLRLGRSDDAKKVFTTALEKNPKNVPALSGQGMVQLKQGQFVEAELSFNAALAENPSHKQAQLGLCVCKLMSKKYDEAYKEADKLLTLDNRSGEAYGIQSMARLFTGDKESFAAFQDRARQALELKPNQPRVLLTWAAGLEQMAKLDEALNTDESLASAKKERELAAAKYAELTAMDPPDAYIQYVLGERKFRENDMASAETAFRRTAKLAPNYAPAFGALGAVLLKLSKWEAAKDIYAQAVKLDPAGAEYHAGLGLALLKLKLLDEASQSFKKAGDLDHHNATALCGLGYIQNYYKEKLSAINFFQLALAADGSCAYAADALKKIFAQDNATLEYHNFADNQMPQDWRVRAAGSVKAAVASGKVVFSGTQGASAGSKVEFYKEIKADDFQRLEADLEISPQSPVSCGLRLAAGIGSIVNFELEFGKDETNQLKVRFRDYSGESPWKTVQDWPVDGHVRLGMDTEELKTGKIILWVNGKQAVEVNLQLQRPTRVAAGVFVQAPPKEVVAASADNICLVTRGAPVVANELPDAVKILKDDAPKKAPEKKE